MNRQPISRARRENQVNVKDRYSEAYKRYISSEFSYNSHCLLRKLCENGQKQPHLYNVPLYKIMIQITKIMMMNQLELLFFGATVQDMGWKVVENCLTPYIDEVADITPKIIKESFVKKIQLSLLLIAYIVKIYLNEDSTVYDFKIRDLIKNNFDKMYQEWVQKVQNNFKFSPKHMNRLFKELDKAKSNKLRDKIVDYNQKVTELFKNSPEQQRNSAYPSHKVQKEKQSNDKFDGLVVQQDEDEQYKVPTLYGRTQSHRSQMSALGFGKKQSIHELFDKDQLKRQKNFSNKQLLDDDYLGGGSL